MRLLLENVYLRAQNVFSWEPDCVNKKQSHSYSQKAPPCTEACHTKYRLSKSVPSGGWVQVKKWSSTKKPKYVTCRMFTDIKHVAAVQHEFALWRCRMLLLTWVSRYQKGKTSLDLNEARDDGGFGWTCHQLDHMLIICTLLHIDNHTNTSSLNCYRPDALPDTQPTVSKQW